MTMVDAIGLQASFRVRTAAPHLDVAVDPAEDAIVLVENDGAYRWIRPEASSATGTRHFTVPLTPGPTGEEPLSRGVVHDFVSGQVRTWVFRFAAPRAVGRAIAILEGDAYTGLMRIRELDPSRWSGGDGPGRLDLPDNRPARLLVLIHDTFGSTAGSFGALGATPWGTAFLQAGLAHYDAVLGFEHRTLADSPGSNAADLLAQLRAQEWGTQAPVIDIVAHGRGTLVARALVDGLLPEAGWDAQVRSSILVAGPNAGTELARAENWAATADLYTNLAVGACRALALLPQAAPAATILAGALRSIGGLVKQLASSGLDEEQVPGLAAMRPGSDFLADLASATRARAFRSSASPSYYVIAANFEPRLADSHEPRELPRQWVTRLASGVVDRLLGGDAHDLVVETASMQAVDGPRDSLCFDNSPYIYHTNYFSRPEVVNALNRWLDLPAPRDDAAPSPARGPASATGLIGRLPELLHAATELPAAVDADIIVESAARPASELLASIERSAPSFVVLRRSEGGLGNAILNYVYTPSELHERLENAGPVPAVRALDLHESDSTTATPVPALRPGPDSGRIVAVDGDWPVGVVPRRDEFILNGNIDVLSDMVTQFKDTGLVRRAMPSQGASPPPEAPPPSPVSCHVAAQMAPSVRQGGVTPVQVTLSREAISQASSATSATAPLPDIDPERKLLVDVIPKRGFALADDSEQAQVDLPRPGSPIDLYFSVRAMEPGKGEIRVVVRQRQLPLASLTLYPEVVPAATAVTPVVQLKQEAEVHPAPAGSWPPHVLLITEEYSERGHVFRFELQSPSLGKFKRYRSDPVLQRESFVQNIYEDIESRWLGSQGQQDAFADDLQSMGAGLWTRLLPKELRDDLWSVRDALDSIYVVSEEPFIPWELVYMTEPGGTIGAGSRFLAEAGLVRWLYEANLFPPEILTVRPGMTRYLIPTYPAIPEIQLLPLPEAEKEAAFLRAEFMAVAVPPLLPDVRRLLEGPAGFDLLHFAGHGFAASATINEPQLVLEGEVSGQDYIPVYLRADAVEARANFGALRPMVVLNACQAGRQNWKLTGIGGFAQAFLRRGAGAFVGTLWSVGDAPARNFTEAMYRALKAGDPMAAAVRAGRAAARAAGDATWLAYAVYGHPAARLQ
jgi:hypothetical protein